MNNIRTLPIETRHDEASIWLAKLERGLTDAESAELQAWMAADPRNQDTLLDMAHLWDRMGVLASLSDVAVIRPRARTRHDSPGWWVGRMAAVFALVAVLAGVWQVFDSGELLWAGKDAAVLSEASVYETPVGSQSTVELSDGSFIKLNTNSLIKVQYTADLRLITLVRGEIHIDVAHDGRRPLHVVAGNRILQAVGTAFSVKIKSADQVELIVTDGVVRVGTYHRGDEDPGNKTFAVQPSRPVLSVAQGEEVMLGSSTETVEKLSPDEIEVRLSWLDGDLVFRGVALREAVEEISRYTSVEFVFHSDAVESTRIAGLFKAGDVKGFLSTLRTNFDVTHEEIDTTHILLKPMSTKSERDAI